MYIKDKLNEFEADWAAMPTVEKEKLAQLKNKTILICGHEIARCLCYALLYLNETQKLRIKVILSGENNEALTDYNSEFLLRNDFDFVDFNSLSELKNVDYIIYTGICGEKSKCTVELFSKEINAVKAISKVAVKTSAQVVLLSDSRVYGNGKNHRIYAENEYAQIDINSASAFDTQLLRTIENF